MCFFRPRDRDARNASANVAHRTPLCTSSSERREPSFVHCKRERERERERWTHSLSLVTSGEYVWHYVPLCHVFSDWDKNRERERESEVWSSLIGSFVCLYFEISRTIMVVGGLCEDKKSPCLVFLLTKPYLTKTICKYFLAFHYFSWEK